MPSCILLSTITAQGDRTLHSNPERIAEVDREISQFGCKVVA